MSDEAPEGGRRGLVAVLVAAAIGLAVLLLFVRGGRKPPDLSPTLTHRAALGGRNADACLSCHLRGDAPRRPPGHTGREDCWDCHAIAEP